MAATLEIEARLKDLESILGVTVLLADLPDEEPEFLLEDKEHKVAQQKEGEPSPSTKAASHAAKPEDVSTSSDELEEMPQFNKLKPHDLSDEGISFCPWKLVKGYPDSYVGNANRERVRPFFDNALKDRDWYFFHIGDLHDHKKAHLLVPSDQFNSLLRSINKRLGTELTVPHGTASRSFNLRFSDCGPFRPRFLHRHRHRASAEALASAATSSGFDIEDPRTWPKKDQPPAHAHADDDALAALDAHAGARLRDNMERMRREPAKASKLTAAQRAEKRHALRRKAMGAMRRHLALRDDGVLEEGGGSDVVFFCVDVEAVEDSPQLISEIGIAILDMRRVGGQPPGDRGRDWWPLIEAHHLRIEEYAGLTNYRYCHGCPNDFQFGESTFPPKSEAREAVRAVLRPYLDAKRRIVLAGHDVKQDVKYMACLGFDLERETRCVDTVDSQVLYYVWRKTDRGGGLQATLDELGFEYAYLHNAGNDAVHTLRAAIGVAFADTEPVLPAETASVDERTVQD